MALERRDGNSHRGATLRVAGGGAMRTKLWGAALISLVAACGSGERRSAASESGVPAGNDTASGGDNPSGGTPTVEPPTSGPRCGGAASLWLSGTHTGLLSSFRIAARTGQEPTASGDLAAVEAYRVGDLPLPASGPVTASLAIEAVHVAGGAASGDVTVCGAPVAFTFQANDVDAERCRVVVSLDLSRSLQRDPATGALLLIPQASLRF